MERIHDIVKERDTIRNSMRYSCSHMGAEVGLLVSDPACRA